MHASALRGARLGAILLHLVLDHELDAVLIWADNLSRRGRGEWRQHKYAPREERAHSAEAADADAHARARRASRRRAAGRGSSQRRRQQHPAAAGAARALLSAGFRVVSTASRQRRSRRATAPPTRAARAACILACAAAHLRLRQHLKLRLRLALRRLVVHAVAPAAGHAAARAPRPARPAHAAGETLCDAAVCVALQRRPNSLREERAARAVASIGTKRTSPSRQPKISALPRARVVRACALRRYGKGPASLPSRDCYCASRCGARNEFGLPRKRRS